MRLHIINQPSKITLLFSTHTGTQCQICISYNNYCYKTIKLHTLYPLLVPQFSPILLLGRPVSSLPSLHDITQGQHCLAAHDALWQRNNSLYVYVYMCMYTCINTWECVMTYYTSRHMLLHNYNYVHVRIHNRPFPAKPKLLGEGSKVGFN